MTMATTARATTSFGTLHQGYLESSNVDPVKEITELISAQRAYEMNSKVIQAADDMAGVSSKGIREGLGHDVGVSPVPYRRDAGAPVSPVVGGWKSAAGARRHYLPRCHHFR